MVGPRGSFWHTADRRLTAEPAMALLELHRAGVPLVLVSGRTHAQLLEATRLLAADGAIAELGALVSWDGARETRMLPGEMPADYDGRAPLEVMTELGVVERLFAEHPGSWSGTRPGTPRTPPTRCCAAGWIRSPSTPGWPRRASAG